MATASETFNLVHQIGKSILEVITELAVNCLIELCKHGASSTRFGSGMSSQSCELMVCRILHLQPSKLSRFVLICCTAQTLGCRVSRQCTQGKHTKFCSTSAKPGSITPKQLTHSPAATLGNSPGNPQSSIVRSQQLEYGLFCL